LHTKLTKTSAGGNGELVNVRGKKFSLCLLKNYATKMWGVKV